MSALVSVIIPAYNAAHCLPRALRSALAQEFEGSLEVIVVDDGSRDLTLGVARAFAASDSRIRVLSQGNSGPAAARNAGVALARGELLSFLDADDEWLPGKLAKQVAVFRDRPKTILVGCLMEGQRPLGRRRGVAVDFKGLLGKNSVYTSGATARADALKAAGGFDPLRRYSEDFELWLRMSRQGEVFVVNEPLFRYCPGALSSRLWTMERGELATYRILAREGAICPCVHDALRTWSILRFLARWSSRLASRWLPSARRDNGKKR